VIIAAVVRRQPSGRRELRGGRIHTDDPSAGRRGLLRRVLVCENIAENNSLPRAASTTHLLGWLDVSVVKEISLVRPRLVVARAVLFVVVLVHRCILALRKLCLCTPRRLPFRHHC
jgi:hypothetical protein